MPNLLPKHPDTSEVKLKPDGSQVFEDCYQIGTRIESRERIISTEDRPLPMPTGPSDAPTPPRMCQKYEIRQPEKRAVLIYDCLYFTAQKKTSLWRTVLIGIGILGTAILVVGITGGTGLPIVAGLLTSAGVTAGTAISVGGSIATVGFGAASLIPSGDSIDDYERGQLLGKGSVEVPQAWQNDGPSREVKIGVPFPC